MEMLLAEGNFDEAGRRDLQPRFRFGAQSCDHHLLDSPDSFFPSNLCSLNSGILPS